MLGGFAELECGKVERLRLAARFALDQRLTDAVDFKASLLLAADQVADRLAVISIAASVDLRYDFIEPLTPETSPEGWIVCEFTVRDLGGGWALDDGVAFSPSGQPLALVRQRRRPADALQPRHGLAVA